MKIATFGSNENYLFRVSVFVFNMMHLDFHKISVIYMYTAAVAMVATMIQNL